MSNLKAYFEMDASHQMAFRMGQAFEQEQTQPATLEQRQLTLSDLVEVAESMGGEVVESLGVVFDDVPEGKDGLILAVGSRAWSTPGRYLVMPIPEEGQ